MSINCKQITVEQKDKILSLEENHFYDFKSKDIQPKKLTRTISAFANTDGGELYLGINESRDNNGKVIGYNWEGFKNIEAANGHLQALSEIFPFNHYFFYEFLQVNDSTSFVLHITILKTPSIIEASENKVYIRKGAQNLLLTTIEGIKRLEYDKGVTTYERQTVNIPKETLVFSDITSNFILNIVPSSNSEAWLKKQLLIINDLPTVAGILIFNDEPQAALPKQSGIKIYRYKTKNKDGKRENLAFDPITVDGNIYDQIHQSVNKTIEIVEDIKILTEKGFEKINYPPIAIHEIITNAVLHRDYSITKDIHIRIFDNRIEIESPGKLPGHISPQNILKEQFARNGALVRIINKFPNPPNKDIGEGLNTAFESLRKLKLKYPDIVEQDNSVLVIIRHEMLASPEEIVMNYIQINSTITNSIGRELTGIESENGMKKVFQRLQSKGFIYLDPEYKGSLARWNISENEENNFKVRKDQQFSLFDDESLWPE